MKITREMRYRCAFSGMALALSASQYNVAVAAADVDVDVAVNVAVVIDDNVVAAVDANGTTSDTPAKSLTDQGTNIDNMTHENQTMRVGQRHQHEPAATTASCDASETIA